MNVNTLFALYAAALLLSMALTLAGGRLVLAWQRRRLRARGCRCAQTLFVEYRRSDCPVHGWVIEQAVGLPGRRRRSSMPVPSFPAEPRRSYQAPRFVHAGSVRRRRVLFGGGNRVD